MSGPTSTRPLALSLYRRLLRSASLLPTANRRGYVRAKTRAEFRDHREVGDPDKISFLIMLGETNLDDIKAQAGHLKEISRKGGYHEV